MSDASMVATATGSLERTPLSNLLIYCLDKGLSGTLVLQSPENKRHAIYFQRGVPAKVRTGEPVALLGRVLVEMELCTQDDVEDALVASKTLSCPVGQALMDAGKLEAAPLLVALKAQAQRKLTSLFSLPESSAYGFFEGRNLLEAWGGPELVPLDTLALIWAGVRASPPIARVEASLAPLGAAPLKLHVDGDFRRFQLTDRARGVVDLLKAKPMPMAQLLDSGVASEGEIKLVVYTFLITRHIELGGSMRPPVGFTPPDASQPGESSRTAVARVRLKSMVKRPAAVEVSAPSSEVGTAGPATPRVEPPPAPSPSSALAELAGPPELLARRKEIRERAETIDTQDFFVILGLPSDASPDAVKSAYFQLAKQWHPDRLPPELGDVRELAAKVFSRLSEAFQTLTDADRRKQYLDMLKQGGGSPEEQAKVAQILEAQMEFQKAEILLKKGDLAAAERLAEKAARNDPEQVDYQALLAWLRAAQPGATSVALEQSLSMLDMVLQSEPKHQRSLWYRGVLRKRAGREAEAMGDFRRLLELDPRHIDAMREVRVYEMRGGKKPADKPEKGEKGDEKSKVPFGDLVGKLFKK